MVSSGRQAMVTYGPHRSFAEHQAAVSSERTTL
ncbi:hypothetical protein QF048_007733 [Streptomyces sp. W4I9-2]|nr:hypothetical protein [Streptomyces sp. W4I9-2]